MAYRFGKGARPGKTQEFMLMELIGVNGGKENRHGMPAHLVLVDNSQETLLLVRECLAEIVANVVRAGKLAHRQGERKAEDVELFARNIEPLLAATPDGTAGGLLDSLSRPLKKALLRLAMESFDNDRESASRALGITAERLEQEMRACGLAGVKRRA